MTNTLAYYNPLNTAVKVVNFHFKGSDALTTNGRLKRPYLSDRKAPTPIIMVKFECSYENTNPVASNINTLQS